MPAPNSQILYGWSGDLKPLSIEIDGKKRNAVDADDFMNAMKASEESFGQKILQDNSEVLRLANLIADNPLVQVDPSTVTTNQLAEQLNNAVNILTNLVQQGKNRS